jgi:hypothetical protein
VGMKFRVRSRKRKSNPAYNLVWIDYYDEDRGIWETPTLPDFPLQSVPDEVLVELKRKLEGEFSAVKKDSKNFNKGQITGSYKKPRVSQTLDELQMWERQQGR